MSPICQVNTHRPECQQWRMKEYAKCRDLLSRNAPNEFSMWWLYDTPAIHKDMEILTPADCHKLKRELAWEVLDAEEDNFGHVIGLGVFLAVTVIVLLLVLLCGIKRRTKVKANATGPQSENKEPPIETPQVKEKKKLNNFKRCFLHSEVQAQRQELKTEKQVAGHTERSQRKLAAWTKARERNAQRKKEKLDRKLKKEYDRIHQITQQK